MSSSNVAVRFERGVYLPSLDLWLDPRDPRPAAFISHAHSDHIGRHEEVLLTEPTARLLRARLPGKRLEHVRAFGEPFPFRGAELLLLPAGHIAGSAQLHVTESDGASLLYTGDFKLRPGLSAEPLDWRAAHTLVMETTFGLPQYRFPPTDEIMAQVVEFCRDALADDAVPVLFGYSLGKGQEILCAIAAAGFPIMLHGAVYKMAEIYRELRPDFPAAELYESATLAGHVLICPPSASGSRMVQRIKRKRTAVLTGWAMDSSAVYRYGCDAAFPLSDHAGYDDLVRYVELVQPRRVLTLHGFAQEFAADLRRRGVEAWALGEENQLEMNDVLAPTAGRLAPAAVKAEITAETPGEPGDFRHFARVCFEVAATPAKLRKIALLADYLRTLDDDSLAVATQFLTGSAFARSQSRVVQAGWSVVKRALLSVSGLSETELRGISVGRIDQSDLAREALRGKTNPAAFTLLDSQALFVSLESARGPIEKSEILQRGLARLTPDEAAVIIKVVSGDLRIGLKEGLLEEGIAAAAGVAAEDVREANMLSGDIGYVARLARHHDLGSARLTLFHPIKVMLASPEPTAAAIWERQVAAGRGERDVWIEDKFDGIRAQLHCGGTRAEIFSRDLRRVTAQFDELAAAGRDMGREVIFDGEIVAFDADRPLTFFDLQKRLGRRSPDLFLGATIPVIFVAFDLLALDGESLLRRPLRERRSLLETLKMPAAFRVVEVLRAAGADAIEAAFRASRHRQREGLMVKDPDSLYTPGRRGLAWLKLKMELATLDVVVVGAEWGHGKRHHVISDYTFAVRDDASGELLPIGKAYSGLTDVEIAELTEQFLRSTISTRGKFHEVEPQVVLEIAFDSIQPSDRHASGLAMRFPRIKSIRRDKTPAEIDTLSYARSLSLAAGGEREIPRPVKPARGRSRKRR